MTTPTFRALISALIIALLGVYFFHQDLHLALGEMTPIWWLLSSLWAWLIMLLSAMIVFKARLGRLPAPLTLAFFPICQSISGYLLPVQGSLAFASVYFKRAHGIPFRRTISLNLVLGLVSATMVGVCGLGLVLMEGVQQQNWPIFAFVATTPAALILSIQLLGFRLTASHLPKKKSAILRALQAGVGTIYEQVTVLASSPSIALLYAGKIFLYTAWFVFLDHALGLNLHPTHLLYLVFAVEASIIFKVTPGNWGVSQASGGVALSLIGAPIKAGVLLVTISMISVLILNLVLGYFATRYLAGALALRNPRSLYRAGQ